MLLACAAASPGFPQASTHHPVGVAGGRWAAGGMTRQAEGAEGRAGAERGQVSPAQVLRPSAASVPLLQGAQMWHLVGPASGAMPGWSAAQCAAVSAPAWQLQCFTGAAQGGHTAGLSQCLIGPAHQAENTPAGQLVDLAQQALGTSAWQLQCRTGIQQTAGTPTWQLQGFAGAQQGCHTPRGVQNQEQGGHADMEGCDESWREESSPHITAQPPLAPTHAQLPQHPQLPPPSLPQLIRPQQLLAQPSQLIAPQLLPFQLLPPQLLPPQPPPSQLPEPQPLRMCFHNTLSQQESRQHPPLPPTSSQPQSTLLTASLHPAAPPPTAPLQPLSIVPPTIAPPSPSLQVPPSSSTADTVSSLHPLLTQPHGQPHQRQPHMSPAASLQGSLHTTLAPPPQPPLVQVAQPPPQGQPPSPLWAGLLPPPQVLQQPPLSLPASQAAHVQLAQPPLPWQDLEHDLDMFRDVGKRVAEVRQECKGGLRCDK